MQHLLSDHELEVQEKHTLLPEEKDLLSFYKFGDPSGSTLNHVMPHRSIDEWAAWIDKNEATKRSCTRAKELDSLENLDSFISKRLKTVSDKYNDWYPVAPMEKPPLPEIINDYPILVGLNFDLIIWYTYFPSEEVGKETLDELIEQANDDLDFQYPHLNRRYLEKFSRYVLDPKFYSFVRAAKEFVDNHGDSYYEWLQKAHPDFYATGEIYTYKFKKTRRISPEAWKTIEEIIKNAKVGKQLMFELRHYFSLQLVQEAFYRSSGLSGPALAFLKARGDIVTPISGVWTTFNDLALLQGDYSTIQKLHGDVNLRVRRKFLLGIIDEVKSRQNKDFNYDDQQKPTEIITSAPGPSNEKCPTEKDWNNLRKSAIIDPLTLEDSLLSLQYYKDEHFLNFMDS